MVTQEQIPTFCHIYLQGPIHSFHPKVLRLALQWSMKPTECQSVVAAYMECVDGSNKRVYVEGRVVSESDGVSLTHWLAWVSPACREMASCSPFRGVGCP